MPTMLEHMQALVQESGWGQLSVEKTQPVWRVALEDNLDAEFFALAGRLAVMRGVVLKMPSLLEERESLIKKAAQLQIAVVRERASILSFEHATESLVPDSHETDTADRLICFRCVPLQTPVQVFVAHVQDWLNDYAWWKASLSEAVNQGDQKASFSDLFAGIRI